ncbi:MAG: hypothetical protein IPI87_15775 [Betaproteobacteria bacterium]|nr:hypothetical protein [Betaproteobacteria bacterium]
MVAEDTALARASQIQPHTFRLDRARLLEYARRRLLGSRVGDLYYGITAGFSVVPPPLDARANSRTVEAQLEGAAGTASRLELRPCTLRLAKQ